MEEVRKMLSPLFAASNTIYDISSSNSDLAETFLGLALEDMAVEAMHKFPIDPTAEHAVCHIIGDATFTVG